MSDEQTEVETPMSDEAASDVAVEEGIEAIKKIHYIERQMLNRAIHSLCMITEKSPEEVLGILSEGIDTDYDAAYRQAQASSKVLQELHLPPKPKPTWQV